MTASTTTITTTAPAACLIGWPATHSRSPIIHRYWLREFGINGDYRTEAVHPDDFAAFIAALSANGYVGANVTIPHKEQALALSNPDSRARAVGAANTLWFDNGVLCSTNTDVEGFIDNLDDCAPGWDSAGDAVVLGAGGAARAVVYALIECGFRRIHLVNRTPMRAVSLREAFGKAVNPVEWHELPELLPRANLFVNTTSLGMKGQEPLPVDVARLPDQAVVADLVYVPLETELVQAARARGLRVADGLGMLLHQAVRGFELWFGRRPTVTAELRRLVEVDLVSH
ncbi:MAG: shikimate dehydrogenase [Xanthobacteraceae bacterium]|nr:MAG: shikimate dehydrogenase [Xanthobacteraceae bacterium]